MKTKISKLDSFKPMLFFFGAYIFSHCLYLLIHETGHAIAFAFLRYSDIQMHVTPFSGYVTITGFFRSDLEMFLIFLAGPLFSVIFACAVIILFWHKRNPYFLPAFMYSSTAFLHEGTVILNCFLNGSEIIYDFDTLMFLGLSPIIVGIICGILLSVGFGITFMIWPLIGISPSNSFLRKLFVNLAFIFYSIFIIILTPLFVPIGSVTQFYLIFLYLSSALFFILRIALYKPVFPFIDRLTHTDVIEVSWLNVQYSLGLGSTIFILLLFFLN